MITDIHIENYKSIDKLTLDLGRINVFIGENGAGKSNILEVIALAGAAAADKLDNEFLTSRGIRVTAPEFMRAAFDGFDPLKEILISIKETNSLQSYFRLSNTNEAYSKWLARKSPIFFPDDEEAKIEEMLSKLDGPLDFELISSIESDKDFHKIFRYLTFRSFPIKQSEINNFIIYSPENSALRTFQREGQIEPLGINGEGLLKLISVYSKEAASPVLEKIKAGLALLDWFVDFSVPHENAEGRLHITDRHLDAGVKNIDHRSTNEGFFFLLFYFALFSSDLTPKFFAVDNIDASLNPKLCQKLMLELTKMAKENDKQAILTTHNPAILDGLDLDDDEQRLFVISRGRNGATKIKRIMKPVTEENQRPHKLSELFLRGVLGGLPKGF